ncbi:hypothetical protein ACNF49_29630 [Actinomadura sp. ATCC 39365]
MTKKTKMSAAEERRAKIAYAATGELAGHAIGALTGPLHPVVQPVVAAGVREFGDAVIEAVKKGEYEPIDMTGIQGL